MLGSKETVLFDIGTELENGLLRFDIWFCGVRLTEADNMAHVSSTITRLEFELNQLKSEQVNSDKLWFNFGPITDDVSATIHLLDTQALISVDFDEHVYKLDISIPEIQGIYEQAINVFSAKNT